jgi:hypothetical protein
VEGLLQIQSLGGQCSRLLFRSFLALCLFIAHGQWLFRQSADFAKRLDQLRCLNCGSDAFCMGLGVGSRSAMSN